MKDNLFRTVFFYVLLITMGTGQIWAYDPHFYLTGKTPTGSWSNSATAWFLVSPASDSYDQYCTYVWLSENDYFGLNNGKNRYSRCDNNDQEIKDGYGSGQFGYPHDNSTTDKAFKYIGATGLVRINVSEADDNCGNTEHCREYYPWVWVNERLEIGILKGEKVMFYFGSSTGKGDHNWFYLSTTSKTSHSASEQYHRLNETKCSSYISVAYVDAGVQYYISDYSSWGGMQMEENAIAGSLYSIYKENDVDKIYRNAGAIPHFSTTTVNKTVGTTDSEIEATAETSIYGNEQVLYYYYTTDGGTTFTKFDPSDISSLAVGVYTVYALGWDGHILVRSDNTVTLNVGVTISLNANGGTDGDVTSVFATSGVAASTGNIASASLPTKTGYTFNGFWTSGGTEVIDENGEWIVDVSGYTDDSGNWTCSAASTLYAHWTPKTYTINLANMEATEAGTTSVTLTYNASTNMTSPITKPTKTNYTFDGYWVRNESTLALETQLIDANGNWIKDVTDYTGNDGAGNPTWVHDYPISLYAKWTETPRTITLNVSPEGAGSFEVGGEAKSHGDNITAYLATATPTITATPSHAAWKFKEWQYSIGVGPKYGTGGDNMVQITADQDGTLTAVFEPRYGLIGSLNEDGDPAGGMPNKNGKTWGTERSADYEADFEVVGFTALGTGDGTGVDLQCTRSLLANKQYKFQVVDRSTIGRDRFCLEENGSAVLEEGNSVTLTNKEKGDANVLINTGGEGNYTFKITNISNDGNYYPTLIVIRPQQVNFGQKYQDIDGALHEGTTGGSVAVAKTAGGALATGDWVTYNTSVTHTATAASPGYTFAGWWNSDAFTGEKYSDTNPMEYPVIRPDNAFAKFTEKATTVTLSNDEHGKVQINSTDKTSTTCGVTTTRELTAVPNDGYMFSSWTKTSGDDITISSTSTNPTTLRGQGAGATSGQTVTANFTYRWALKAESAGWGESEFIIENITTDGSGDVVGYVEITLAANTNYQFKMKDLLTNDIYKNNNTAVQYMTYTNHTDWGFATDYTFNCGITTAGKGTYRFTWNVTDKTMTVTYPTSYQVNYGASVGGSVTSVKDDDNNDVPNGGYVRSGGRVTYTAAANAYYTFVGWCNNETYGAPFNTELSWTNSNVTETQNSFAKFKSTNFVIYRSGDMAEDDRAALDDVESYAGGTISEAIEFRMKVHTLDQWYTLCLPFEVSHVKVWEDGEYYDIVPFYRPEVGGTFYTGHYIIRTPSPAVGYAIETFETNWQDPANSSVLPSKNVPYIIQWHDNYFLNKYISFFGASGQTIPGSMTEGAAPSDNTLVNVYGNDAMTIGSVKGAYMFESDYGAGGAWLRDEDPDADRLVLPFDCYIRATKSITRKYRVIRRGMTIEDTATGWQDVLNSENKVHIAVYTLSGILIAQYDNCSFTEVANRLRSEQHTGLFILRTVNESVKLMIGGK